MMRKQHKRDYVLQRRKIDEIKKKIEGLFDDEKTSFNLEHIDELEAYKETKKKTYNGFDYKFGKFKLNIRNFDYEIL